MSARGLVHFHAHFANLLADGQPVDFADFGLALSRGFELSAEECDFLADHLVYDPPTRRTTCFATTCRTACVVVPNTGPFCVHGSMAVAPPTFRSTSARSSTVTLRTQSSWTASIIDC
ncbi:hypothetical protein OHS70_37865 [Streptomyces sp. NBC_00390]|uniref:hypothetical protein n=1 Tax=Streptomyces sp. NBC_00390 TaxID=2975736 RepID=UPI002E24E57C